MKRFIYSIYDMVLSFFVCNKHTRILSLSPIFSLSCSFVPKALHAYRVCIIYIYYIYARFERIYRIRDFKFYLQIKAVVLFQPKNKQFRAGVFFFLLRLAVSSSSRERGSHVHSHPFHTLLSIDQ